MRVQLGRAMTLLFPPSQHISSVQDGEPPLDSLELEHVYGYTEESGMGRSEPFPASRGGMAGSLLLGFQPTMMGIQ